VAWYTYQVTKRLVYVFKQQQGFASTISVAVMLVLLMEGFMKCTIEMDPDGNDELDPICVGLPYVRD
jgi:hypothetical protein